jgi:hypothetical protein
MHPVDSSGILKSKILYSRNQNPDDWFQNLGELKEDTIGKIYLNSTLLYDFSLLPGDTFGSMKCLAADSILMNGSFRHRWIFKCLTSPIPTADTVDIWLEGIGSIMHGLFYPGAGFCSGVVGNPFTELICFHQAGNLLFMNSFYSDCLQTSTFFPPNIWPAETENHWTYNYKEPNSFGGYDIGNVTIRSIKDTIFHGWSCQKYSFVTINHLNQQVSNFPIYMRQSINKILYSVGGAYYELFNFGAGQGYTWTSRNPYEIYGLTPDSDSLTTFTVDSVYYEPPIWNWEPFSFRTLGISSNSGWKFKLPVREVTGGRWFFFPGKWDEWTTAHPAELRCFHYFDVSGQESTTYFFPCFYLSTGINEPKQEDFRILTFSDHFKIEHNYYPNTRLNTSLYDIYGRLLYQSESISQLHIIIPTAHLSAGVYFIKLIFNNTEISTKKIFK